MAPNAFNCIIGTKGANDDRHWMAKGSQIHQWISIVDIAQDFLGDSDRQVTSSLFNGTIGAIQMSKRFQL
jgi:hypothetical protein